MKLKITKNYLVLPTNGRMKKKRLRFFEDGKEVYFLNVRLDPTDPDFYAYIDMRRFLGKELELEISPTVEFSYTESDTMEGEYNDSLRPYIHFTTKRGWVNDPNGLVKVGDEYHLFYQHNPAERAWDNMHWGHAVSKDLFHWKELPVALFPDETGSMYSGCAIVDERNVSRLGKNGEKAVLLYYTAAGSHASVPVEYTQGMVYSVDGLKTFEKYAGNPVIDHIVSANRDPKVVWCEELNAYVMSLYLVDDEFALFTSEDLLAWKELQRVHIPMDNECPNFFPLKDGSGKKKWVFMGAHDVYLIGDFVGGKFVASQGTKRMNSRTNSYAAQTYTDMADGRTLRIAWNRWGGMKAKTFSQQMGIPCEIGLEKLGGEYYLDFTPVPELQTVTESTETYEALSFKEKKTFVLGDRAVGIHLQGAYAKEEILSVTCFGVEFVLDFGKNEITVGDFTNALSVDGGKLDVRIIADRSGVEVFCDGGRIAFAVCEAAVCDGNLPYAEISSEGEYTLEKLTIEKYRCAWEKEN